MIKSNTDIWKPTPNISSDTDVRIKEIENKQFVMEYKAEMDEALELKIK